MKPKDGIQDSSSEWSIVSIIRRTSPMNEVIQGEAKEYVDGCEDSFARGQDFCQVIVQ